MGVHEEIKMNKVKTGTYIINAYLAYMKNRLRLASVLALGYTSLRLAVTTVITLFNPTPTATKVVPVISKTVTSTPQMLQSS